MPSVIGEMQLTTFAAASVGDLVVYGDGGSTSIRQIAIVVEAFSDRHEPLAIVLNDEYERHPTIRRIPPAAPCLSFGGNWLVEPIHDDHSYPRSMRPSQIRAGRLALADGWWLEVATSPSNGLGRYSTEWWNIQTGASGTIDNNAVTFVRWDIWLSLTDRANHRAKPFYSHDAEVADVETR